MMRLILAWFLAACSAASPPSPSPSPSSCPPSFPAANSDCTLRQSCSYAEGACTCGYPVARGPCGGAAPPRFPKTEPGEPVDPSAPRRKPPPPRMAWTCKPPPGTLDANGCPVDPPRVGDRCAIKSAACEYPATPCCHSVFHCIRGAFTEPERPCMAIP